MKKLFLGIIAFIGILFLTACGCSKEDFEVIFSNDGNRTIVTVEKGERVEEPNEPTKDGYVFIGWFKNLTDKEAYDFDDEVTSNFTLYAKWEKEKVCDLTCKDGYTLVNPDSENCYCEKNKEDEETANNQQTQKPSTNNQQTTIKYTVKFETDGGSSISNVTVVKGNKVNKPTDPTKEGYKFVGWYLNNKSYDFSSSVVSNITLVAKWEKLETPKDPVEEPEKEPELSYRIDDIPGSIVGEAMLYLTKDGVASAGNADIVTIDGDVINKNIPATGYRTNKGIIDKVINIKIN